MKRFLFFVCLLVLSGCVSTSGFLSNPDDGNASLGGVNNTKDYLYLIYSHGSLSENKKDPCFPASDWLPGRVPRVVADLDQQRISGLRVLVYVLCTKVPAREHNDDPSRIKVMLRAEEIQGVLRALHDIGVPAQQVFLVGHSAGAWASLLAMKYQPQWVNAVIGFAPAFAGVKKYRNDTWAAMRVEHQQALLAAPDLPSLLYGFADDPYYDAQDLEFLKQIPGTQLEWISGGRCSRGHGAVFRTCFRDAKRLQILDFIRSRIQP